MGMDVLFALGAGAVVGIVIAAVAVLVVLWVIGAYNGLVRLRQRVRNAWAQIDVQLKRRYDLIPNLIETVKGYATHEKELLENVTKARAHAIEAGSVGAKAQAEMQLSSALGSLMVAVEAYPDLKANQNFLALQEELTSTENKISFSRQNYNNSVTTYNTRQEVFPTNTIAGMFGFTPEELFEIEEKQRDAVQVKF